MAFNALAAKCINQKLVQKPGKDLWRAVVCHVCNKALQAKSLCPHLLSAHDIHQQVVVAEALLEEWAKICYRADPGESKDPIQCPFPVCPGVLSSPYMLCRHFQDLHPKDIVEIPREGTFPRCERCTMQCTPRYPQHIHTQICSLGTEGRTQQDSAVMAALALHKLFHVEGELQEKVDSFRYLGWILAQDNDDVRAVRNQIKKAWGIWARVIQVLMADNTPPKVSTKFYKAVMQSILLYSSKTWNLSTTALVQLEGFHIRVSHSRSLPDGWETQAKEGTASWVGVPAVLWILQECAMAIISHYIDIRRARIFRYMVDWPIYKAYREGEWRRGLPPWQWWWEQKMSLDNEDADGANE